MPNQFFPVDKSVFGLMLNPRHAVIMFNFLCYSREEMVVFDVKESPKAHILMVHINSHVLTLSGFKLACWQSVQSYVI